MSTSGPDEQGVRHIDVESPIGLMDETEHTISRWNVQHPGLLL